MIDLQFRVQILYQTFSIISSGYAVLIYSMYDYAPKTRRGMIIKAVIDICNFQQQKTKNSDFSLSISLCIFFLCFRHRGCTFPPSFPQAPCTLLCTSFCPTAVVGNSNLCVLSIWTHKTHLPPDVRYTLYAKGIVQYPKHVLRCNFSILRSKLCILDAKLRPFMPNFPPFATKFP